MAKIISIVNQKGGVGKTTTSLNISATLAAAKRKILLIDMDAQGNTTMGSGVDKYEINYSTYDLLTQNVPFESIVKKGMDAGYDLIPSNSDLTAAEVFLMDKFARETKLKTILEPIKVNYDYIFIDCPPSLSLLTVNALTASDSIIIPMQCEYFALEGLSALMETVKDLKQAVNSKLEIEGILRTMYDPRNKLAIDVSEQLKEFFGDKVYRTLIPRNIRLAEAPSHGQSVLQYDPKSSGAKAYMAFAGEFLRKNK